MQMKLAVFDIDGTLTLGDGLGTSCFFGTFDALFGGGDGTVDRRLESYAESTDCGIAREAARRALGRDVDTGEFESFKSAYLELLAREIAARERPYRALPGADSILSAVASGGSWQVAIATGNWRRAACLKLECARIGIPETVACSEDGASRAGVLAAAVSAACAAAGGARFERVVYVGDQPWDLRAAREVGTAFVGVGGGQRRARLEREGAVVIESYLDQDAFLSVLDRAAPLGSRGA
ncbi:MAG TPA: HAD family hydrolase [Candidatus Limnocylindrales bacterium]|nr:HAD family hydrolase [Candidatus Limnocylindrales bacterium]